MNRCVYLMSGPAHLPYLVPSLYTLRTHFDGEIDVFAWEESFEKAKRICADHRIEANCRKRKPKYRGKNDQFLDKIDLVQEFDPGDINLYIDADTTIHGKLAPMFDAAAIHGFAATQFNTWRVDSKLMRGRISRLGDFPGIDQNLLQRALVEEWPSVNGGVWAARSNSPVLPLWYQWSFEAKSIFIADEVVLHLLQIKFQPTGEMEVMEGGRWNCSPRPKLQPADLRDEDIIIRHYHGDSNVRLQKCTRGYELWHPIFKRCAELNIGGVRDWYRDVGNKWFPHLLQTHPLE